MKGKYLLLILLLVLPLSGCQLAEQESVSGDRLIGVYLTKEYVDTMNVEAYLNDHMGEAADGKTLQVEEGEAQAYQERIYAVRVSVPRFGRGAYLLLLCGYPRGGGQPLDRQRCSRGPGIPGLYCWEWGG